MTTFESVLQAARSLTPDERELLMVHLGWSLAEGAAQPEEAAYIEQLRRISRHADANPASLLDWDEAELETFDTAEQL